MHAIDTFNGSAEHQSLLRGGSTYRRFKRNLRRGRASGVVVHRGSSDAVAGDIHVPICPLFIDGAHEY